MTSPPLHLSFKWGRLLSLTLDYKENEKKDPVSLISFLPFHAHKYTHNQGLSTTSKFPINCTMSVMYRNNDRINGIEDEEKGKRG